jgi:hypothetical protein
MLRRPVTFTALLLIGWLAFMLGTDAAGARKLQAGGLAGITTPVAVVVTLDFVPEEFHMTRLQEAGRLLGVDGRTVRLADVTPGAVTDLAHEYWISAIRRDGGA